MHTPIMRRPVLAALLTLGLAGGAAAAPFDVKPYKRVFCPKNDCCVSEVIPAGKGRQGETLEVVMLDLAPETKCPPPQVRGGGPYVGEEMERERPSGEPAAGATDGEPCHGYAYHLAVKVGGKIVRSEAMTGFCNDGYGAADVGTDSVGVDPVRRQLSHTRSGGSNWRWTETAVLGLDPPRLIEAHVSTSFMGSLVEQEKEWSWDRFAGKTSSNIVRCNADGSPPESSDDEGASAKGAKSSAMLIPSVTLPEDFRAGGWRTTSLGGCAVTIDGTKGAGFVVHGALGSPKDARMRVVASPEDELFIEIEDDVLVGPGAAIAGKSWVTDDHVEIWTSSERDFGACRQDKLQAQQWAVRLTDGKMFAGNGAPALPTVAPQIERRDHLVRLKLSSVNATYLAVVYSDSDDGKKQERLIATSTVSFGKAVTLGTRFRVPVERASCVPDDKGALRPKVKPWATSDEEIPKFEE
jgi:hypothetical protein